MKVIFLDFDGVLNSCSSLYLHTLEYPRNKSIAAPDPVCVRLMNTLLIISQANVVVSSSWRNGCNMNELREILREEFGLYCAYKINKRRHIIFDKIRPQNAGECRGNQIQDWLDKHPEVTEYVIIDDDSDMLPRQINNFVQYENKHGFRSKLFDRCLQTLKVPEKRLKRFNLEFLFEKFADEILESKI